MENVAFIVRIIRSDISVILVEAFSSSSSLLFIYYIIIGEERNNEEERRNTYWNYLFVITQ